MPRKSSIVTPASLDPETKRAPAERFANAGEVMEVCQGLIKADDPRAKNRAKVQGVIDGNRPYKQGVLLSNGQGWRGNVNYREAEGQVQSQSTPYYDLVTEVNPCVTLEVDYGTGEQQSRWAGTIARHFHAMLFGWDAFDWHTQLCQSEMLVHGWGAHLRLSKMDWRPTTKVMRNILFPDETTSDLEGLEFFVVRESQKAHELYRKVANREMAQRAGWKPDAVTDAIVRASTLGDKSGGRRTNQEEVQRRLKNGDVGYSNSASRQIWLNHLFVREFEGGYKDQGGITHYIIEEGKGDDYLFVGRNRFRDWAEIISLFPYDIGSDGTIHSIRGLGTRIFPFMELSNRLKNHMVDSVMVGSGVLLTSKQNVDPAKLSLTSIGPMKLLPPGIEPTNYKAMDLAQGPLALSRELQETMAENNKTTRQGLSNTSRERTAYEVSVESSDSAKLQKSAHNMYYRGLSRHYRETLRRASNPNYRDTQPGGEEALLFQRRCLRDGVPKEALAKIMTVEATRSLGAGSASQRIMATQQIMQVIYPSTTDEKTRNNIMRDYVAALTGYSTVDRYVPEIATADIPNNDDAMAVLENDALTHGGEAIVTDKQGHVRHVQRHLGKGAMLLQQLQAGQADPQQVMAAWEAMGPHVAAHLVFIERDPTRKAQFQELHQQFVAMSSMADKLAQHLQEHEQAAANEQPAPEQDGDLAMKQLQADYELKKAKIEGDLVIKKAKAESDIASKKAKTDAHIELGNRKLQMQAEQKESLPYKRAGGNTEKQ